MAFIELLLQHKEFFVILLLLAGIFAEFTYIKVLQLDIEKEKAASTTLQIRYDTANSRAELLQSQLQNQNAKIDNLQKEQEARVKAHAAELANANRRAANYKAEADALLKKKPTSSNLCISANDLINEEIDNGKK